MVVINYFLLSNTVPYGNHGCNGGNMYNTYQYVVGNEGVDSQISYSYKARVNNNNNNNSSEY